MAAQDIKAVIFDCFGVLYTDTKSSLRSLVSSDHQAELDDIYKQNDYGYLDWQQFLHAVATLAHKTPQQIEGFVSQEHQLNTRLLRLIGEDLKKDYKIGLLSNIGTKWIGHFFPEDELHELFDGIVLSGEEGMVKPNAEVYELMASRLQVKPTECLMIDDIASNCNGAEMVGMQTVHFTSNDQLLDEMLRLGIVRKTD